MMEKKLDENYQWTPLDLQGYKWIPGYLQELIDLYCFDSKLFKVPEDITPDNLKDFLEIMLKHFQYYHISVGDIMDLGDALGIWFLTDDETLFPDGRPSYPDTDRRELTFYVCTNAFEFYTSWNILPEDVPFIMECLNAPDEQIINMYDRLDKSFEQFDGQARYEEDIKRSKIISQQRIEAIEKYQPLPIRPMGIKLDMCYKKDKDDLG